MLPRPTAKVPPPPLPSPTQGVQQSAISPSTPSPIATAHGPSSRPPQVRKLLAAHGICLRPGPEVLVADLGTVATAAAWQNEQLRQQEQQGAGGGMLACAHVCEGVSMRAGARDGGARALHGNWREQEGKRVS